ncbi:MAG: hypothetical protein AB8B53_13085 [Flavobacteriales bacterium]
MKEVLLFFSAVLLMYSCALKTEITSRNLEISYDPLEDYESFFFLEEDTLTSKDTVYIGQIRTNNTGSASNCTFEKAKALIITEARKLGGNCFILTQHKEPNGLNSMCHILSGRALRLKHPELYEAEITWHPKRKLEIQNFKGPIENRPFQAATYSFTRYKIENVKHFKKEYTLKVNSVFNCEMSYFKPSFKPDAVLSHEQLHFDITELYTRKLRKLIKENKWTYVELMENLDSEAKKLWVDLALYQDLYDSEVYADHTKQKLWTERIQNELIELQDFEHPTIIIRYE